MQLLLHCKLPATGQQRRVAVRRSHGPVAQPARCALQPSGGNLAPDTERTTSGSGTDTAQAPAVGRPFDARLYAANAAAETNPSQDERLKVVRWSPLEGFTPPRESNSREDVSVSKRLLLGKISCLALGAVLLAERLTGEGVLTYICEKQPSLDELHPLVGLWIVGLVIAAVAPTKSKPQQSEAFTSAERVQLWAGRAACLGLAAVLTIELTTGQGLLELMDVETGVEELTDIEAIAAFFTLLILTGKRKHDPERS